MLTVNSKGKPRKRLPRPTRLYKTPSFDKLVGTYDSMKDHPPWLLGRAIVRLACEYVSKKRYRNWSDMQDDLDGTIEHIEAILAEDLGMPGCPLL